MRFDKLLNYKYHIIFTVYFTCSLLILLFTSRHFQSVVNGWKNSAVHVLHSEIPSVLHGNIEYVVFILRQGFFKTIESIILWRPLSCMFIFRFATWPKHFSSHVRFADIYLRKALVLKYNWVRIFYYYIFNLVVF